MVGAAPEAPKDPVEDADGNLVKVVIPPTLMEVRRCKILHCNDAGIWVYGGGTTFDFGQVGLEEGAGEVGKVDEGEEESPRVDVEGGAEGGMEAEGEGGADRTEGDIALTAARTEGDTAAARTEGDAAFMDLGEAVPAARPEVPKLQLPDSAPTPTDPTVPVGPTEEEKRAHDGVDQEPPGPDKDADEHQSPPISAVAVPDVNTSTAPPADSGLAEQSGTDYGTESENSEEDAKGKDPNAKPPRAVAKVFRTLIKDCGGAGACHVSHGGRLYMEGVNQSANPRGRGMWSWK